MMLTMTMMMMTMTTTMVTDDDDDGNNDNNDDMDVTSRLEIGKKLVASPIWRWCLSKVWSQYCDCQRGFTVVSRATTVTVCWSYL